MFSILESNNGYFREILGNYASEPFSQTLSYIKIYRHTNIWIAVQMELTLNFGVGERKIFNDFEKNNFKNVEYNYIMLVSINRLNSIDNHVQWNSCIAFKSYSKCTMKFLTSNNRKLPCEQWIFYILMQIYENQLTSHWSFQAYPDFL